MNYLDLIIIFIVLVGFILGYKDGLVRKIIGLLGLVFGLVFALQFYNDAAQFIAPLVSDEIHLAEIIAGIFIFVVTVFMASVLKRIIHPFDKVNRFMNQFLGGLAGVLQILVFISAFLLFLNIFNFPGENDREKSLLYNPVYQIIPVSIDLILGRNSQAMNIWTDFVEQGAALPDSL